MSFREVRSFAETMRLLGYPNLISMDSFKKPNVELVANCVYWLIKRYEPSAEVVYDIELESDRVFFFKQACKVALSKGRIRLNVKKLYESNGHAVQEMLKLAGILKKAMKSTADDDVDFAALQQMAAQKNVNDAKQVQTLCSDITADGSTLFFMIEKEMNTRSERLRVLSRATEVSDFERRLRELLQTVTQQVEQLQQSISNLTADESNLEQKIESKKTQLERVQKSYKSLMALRPPFVEEYEKNEAELQSQFVKYLEQYRNLEYLEHELTVFNGEEDARLEEQETKLRVMRDRLRKEELKTLRQDTSLGGRRAGELPKTSAGGSSSDDEEDESDSMGRGAPGGPPRPTAALGRSRPSPTVSETIQRGGRRGDLESDDDDDEEDVEEEAKRRAAAFQSLQQERLHGQGRSGSPATGPGGMGLQPSSAAPSGGGGGAGPLHRKPPAPGRPSQHMLDSDDDDDDDDGSSSELSTDDTSTSEVSLDSDSDSDI